MPTIIAYPVEAFPGLEQPTIGSTGSLPASIVAALSSEDVDTWVDFEPVAGNSLTVLGFDTSALPAGAIVTGVALEYATERAGGSVSSLKLRTAAIDADDAVVYGPDERALRVTAAGPSIGANVERRTLAGGQFWDESGSPAVVMTAENSGDPDGTLGHTHRLYWIRALISYTVAPTIEVTTPAGGTVAGRLGTVEWSYTQPAGAPQTHYRIAVATNAVANGVGFDPNISTGWTVDTGRRNAGQDRSVDLSAEYLDDGAYQLYARTWARLADGSIVGSDWDSVPIDLASTHPAAWAAATAVPWDTDAGGLYVELTGPNAATSSNLQIDRSTDGETWTRVEADYVTVVDNGSNFTSKFYDYRAPIGVELTYRVRRLAANLLTASTWTEADPVTITPASLEALDPIDNQPNAWWILVPSDPALNFQPTVATRRRSRQRRSVVTLSARGNTVTSSASLGDRSTIELRARTNTERQTIERLLTERPVFRLVDVFGESSWVRAVDGESFDILPAGPSPTETTRLRDYHTIGFDIVEVREP